jgi:hypothetical protein
MRLGDGSIFKLGGGKRPRGHGARAASTVTVDLQGLAPGQTVLVTLSTDAAGNVAIAIKLMPAPAAGEEQGGRAPKTDPGDDQGDDGDPSDCTDDQSSCGDDSTGDDEEIDGTVTAIAADLSSITLDPGDGDPLATIPVDDATLLDGVAVGDDVAVFVDADGNATEIDLFDSSDDPGDDGDT